MILDFDSPLFWYKLIFILELMLAEFLSVYTLQKKPKFALRVLGSILVVLTVTFFFPLFFYNAIYSSFMFLMLFIVTLLALKFCFDEPWENILFCGIIAYTTQHIAYETYNYLCYILGLGNMVAIYDQVGELTNNEFTAIAYGFSYAVVYWFIWAFVERKIRSQRKIALESVTLLFISGVIVLTDIALSAFITYDTAAKMTDITKTVVYLYNVISCAMSIGIQFFALDKRNAEEELKEIQLMWQQDKRMYELSKQNVELINIKCHDLKYQIRLLRKSEEQVTKEALKDIEKAVNFYDGSVSTGNDVLDLIMAEKSLYCSQNEIKLTCIADGAKLNFISVTDLYSLLENAIRNAIEHVEKNEDIDKRFVRVKIVSKDNLLFIHVENYFESEQELVLVNGLPKTSKRDQDYHGYGMRSMQLIAAKYGGGIDFSVENKLFNLNIVIPIKENNLK